MAAAGPDAYRERVERALHAWLPAVGQADTSRLHRAMRYAVLDGGKRVRPLLVYTTGAALGVPLERLDGPAVAVECIHGYSLIHDDLPAMDDDDLRRGRPTCHIAFDEATAILAGDALQVLAFGVLADDMSMQAAAQARTEMISMLAQASGTAGMAGGQAMDLEVAGKLIDAKSLEHMHRMKTGALIEASVMLGALSSPDISQTDRRALTRYGQAVGLAFQICDDILDEEGELELLGKRPGQDQARAKPTFPSVAGMDAARARADQLHRQAVDALAGFGGHTADLIALSEVLLNRSH